MNDRLYHEETITINNWYMHCICTIDFKDIFLQLNISLTSHEHHGMCMWNHQQLNCLFSSLFRLSNKERNIKALHHLPFMRGISYWAVRWKMKINNGVIRKLMSSYQWLTHWGRVTHICVSKLTIIGSDNGLSPGQCQAIIRTNAGILFIRPLGTNFSKFLVEILIFSFQKMRLKVSSAKRRPFCLGLN